MPSKKKSAAKSSQDTAKELILKWTNIASELKELEDKKITLSKELENISQQLASMEFTVEESTTEEQEEVVEEQETKSKGKGKPKSKAKTTKVTKGKTNKATKVKLQKLLKLKQLKVKKQ